MKTFLDFINKRKSQLEDLRSLNEGFGKGIGNAIESITKIFKKNIEGKVFPLSGLNGYYPTEIGGETCASYMWGIGGSSAKIQKIIAISFKGVNGSNEPYSISICEGDDLLWNHSTKSNVTLYTMGASIAYFLPLICHIVNNSDYKLSDNKVKKYLGYAEQNLSNVDKKRVSESYRAFYIGAQKYNIFEGFDAEYINQQFNEASEKLKQFKKEVYNKAKPAYQNRKEDPKSWKDINADYIAIKNAIKGGAENIEDLDIEWKSNIVIKMIQSEAELEAERKLEEEKKANKDPEVEFRKMRAYCKMVVSGTQPSVILCGAPGVGKTFRVKDLLKGKNYKEGQNLWTIKGKCTPRQLYIALYNFKNKGDIVLIDDADAVVGPKAPEDVINILKAALDSTSDDEGRLVSYGVSGKLEDDEGIPIPKKFYYNGGVIVITNYNAGQLDTALRGRSYIQDIKFSLKDILKIIKNLLPAIDEGIISKAAKIRAYDYIVELAEKKGNEIEISIRTFQICARLFDAARLDDELTDSDVEEMISEQLSLQARRGGKKY